MDSYVKCEILDYDIIPEFLECENIKIEKENIFQKTRP